MERPSPVEMKDPIPVERGSIGARGVMHLDRDLVAAVGYQCARDPRQRQQQLGDFRMPDLVHRPAYRYGIPGEGAQAVMPTHDVAERMPAFAKHGLEDRGFAVRAGCHVGDGLRCEE